MSHIGERSHPQNSHRMRRIEQRRIPKPMVCHVADSFLGQRQTLFHIIRKCWQKKNSTTDVRCQLTMAMTSANIDIGTFNVMIVMVSEKFAKLNGEIYNNHNLIWRRKFQKSFIFQTN